MDSWEEIREEIKMYMRAYHYTQQEISDRMNIHQPQLSRVLNSDTPPNMRVFFKLLKALDLTLKIETL